jgi:hypothetical protein
VIALLLHHHQPDYRDPRTGEPTLPWVRLHATRGYRDVAVALRETGARATVNLVPSLLDQLDHYAFGGEDPWLRRTAAPAGSLSAVDRAHVVNTGFLGNPSMFEWFPAYAHLRGRVLAGEGLDDAGVRDVQVWSQLAWFGWSALRDWPEGKPGRRSRKLVPPAFLQAGL